MNVKLKLAVITELLEAIKKNADKITAELYKIYQELDE